MNQPILTTYEDWRALNLIPILTSPADEAARMGWNAAIELCAQIASEYASEQITAAIREHSTSPHFMPAQE
jgi:hypothetical protein